MAAAESDMDKAEDLWRVKLRRSPAFGQGFVAVLMRRPHACAYECWVCRVNPFDLRDADMPDLYQRDPIEIPLVRGDAVFDALRETHISAAPPLAVGLDGGGIESGP